MFSESRYAYIFLRERIERILSVETHTEGLFHHCMEHVTLFFL